VCSSSTFQINASGKATGNVIPKSSNYENCKQISRYSSTVPYLSELSEYGDFEDSYSINSFI